MVENRKDKILFVEGKEDKAFVELIIRYLKEKSEIEKEKDNLEIKILGSIANLNKNFLTNDLNLFRINYNDIKTLAFLIDADYKSDKKAGFKSRKEKLNNLLRILGFSKITKLNELSYQEISKYKTNTIAYILPNNKDDGMLEDLIYSCLDKDKDVIDCINRFSDCLIGKRRLKENRKSKLKIRSYLVAKLPNNDSTHSIETGIKKDYIDKNKLLDSNCLDELKEFIKKIINN